MQDTRAHRDVILWEKYYITPKTLTEVENFAEYDGNGNLIWWAVYQLDEGDRFFKFWGEGDQLYWDAVEVFPRTYTKIIITYEEKNDDANGDKVN